MHRLVTIVVGLTMTLSGLCSGMGVFAMEEHRAEMQPHQTNHHAASEALISIDAAAPTMACCDAPKHQTDTGTLNDRPSSADAPCGDVKASYAGVIFPQIQDAVFGTPHHPPNDFERRSLAKRE